MIGRKFISSLLMPQRYCASVKCVSSFESKISLKNIYPNSSLDFAKSCQPPNNSDGSFTGYIPIEELTLTFSRSSGPGGQNVNKVNSRVQMKFHLLTAKWLSDDLKKKMEEIYKTKINSEGYFSIHSEKTRSQQLNIADVIDKLRHLISTADYTPPPPDYKHLEMSRRRQEKNARERLREKRDHSIVKKYRQGLDMEM